MKKLFRTKFFAGIFAILLLLGVGYYYRTDAIRLVQGFLNQFQPCGKPITYSIVNLDQRFNLTKTQLLADVARAEKIWEAPANKQLFEYSPTGNLKINLIYDYRQRATDALRKIGIVINNDKSTYDTLKAKYDSLAASYANEKAQINALVATYNADKSALEKDVAYWNKHGGAPKTEYDILQQREAVLNNQIAVINDGQKSLNALVDTINSASTVLNQLIATLNLSVKNYNTVGASTGEKFSEGEYISGAGETTINIYQFNDTNQLVRVLAHEFGHALELEHLNNPEAIMYYLNEGMNEKLTTGDLAALKKACRIK
ncbi:MAG: matrixin family metalloprotease [bacterium]